MSTPHYLWRQLTPKQRVELLTWRKGMAEPLRLDFDTAALRGQAAGRNEFTRLARTLAPPGCAGRIACRGENRFDNSMPLSKLTPLSDGVVAQLVERLNGIEKVAGSRPVGSTILSSP